MRRLLLHLLLGLSLLVMPFGVAAGGLTVSDTVAGLGTSVEITGIVPSTLVDLHLVSEAGEDTVIPVQTDARGNAVVTIPPRLTTEAGSYRVFAVLAMRKITEDVTFDILSDRMDVRASRMTVSNPLLIADGRSAVTVTVSLRDQTGNPLPARPVQIVGSRSEDRITPLTASRETDGNGSVQFTVQTQTPGSIALRAMDLLSSDMLDAVARITAVQPNDLSMGGFETAIQGTTGTSRLVAQVIPFEDTATADVLDHFVVTVSTPAAKVKDVIPLVTIEARDSAERVVESFTGKVRIITPTDPNSTLPGLFSDHGEVTFTGKNRGIVTIPWAVSFSRAGAHRLIVSDESNTVRGETLVTVSGNTVIPDNLRIIMETPRDGDTVNNREILIKGKGPALRNLRVWAIDGALPSEQLTDGTPVGRGETDQSGTFAFTAVIPGTQTIQLEVQDESGQFDSGIIRITLDTQGPALQYTLDPPDPAEGEGVTLTVTSEPGLPEVLLKIEEQKISLTENKPGVYEVLFMAPESGTIDFTISGRDPAGNVTEIDGRLGIAGPALPQVQNLRADPLARGILLHWDPIPDDSITGYRIEVGTSPTTAEITLDTPEPTDTSAVMGLKAGIDYFVTVRALRGNDIGPKSAVIAARTLGMELTVTPQEGSLLLQWTFPDSTPLASFLLEYGSEAGEYSEQRTLDGGMRVFTLKDLLPSLYLVRLTPVSTTGEILHDLAVSGQGTPLSSGTFHPSADDFPGHVKPGDIAPDNGLHEGAPETPRSGLPGIPVRPVLGITALVLGIYWYRRRKAIIATQTFLNDMHRRYHA